MFYSGISEGNYCLVEGASGTDIGPLISRNMLHPLLAVKVC